MKTLPADIWWRTRRQALLALLGDRDCAYAYDRATVQAQARALRAMRSVSRLFYAIKANPHPEILRTIAAAGLSFECVSQAEVERVIESVPGIEPDRLLFTPNFAPRAEYAWALARNIRVTVDNLSVLKDWQGLFAGREILIRLDTESGRGHHEKVRTAGAHSKFGVPPDEIPELPRAVTAAGTKVVGLHSHGGSGSFAIESWVESARALATVAPSLPQARVLNLGGGFGVPEKPGEAPLDLQGFDAALAAFAGTHPGFVLWLEPGRLLVAAAGVLLARVTQTKGKGARRYVGVATGMNSLIRPALYGAWHEIVNLTRLDEPAAGQATVVGPICESGDVLGENRSLPRCEEGDVLLIANAGAYGHVMGSAYNLRPPAEELLV